MGALLKLVGGITNNPLLIVWIALGAFGFGAVSGGGLSWKIQGGRLDSVKSKYAEFVTKTEAAGKIAQKDQDDLKKLHEQTLLGVSNAWNTALPKVRDQAVARYIAAHPVVVRGPTSTGSSEVRGPASSDKGDDGASQKCVPDEPFIRDAAEDALKISVWHKWATDNHIPVRD